MNFNVWKLFKKKSRRKLTRRETEFLPAVLEVTETPPSPLGRILLWTIVALMATGALWSIFGRVDEVAVAPGKIIPMGQVKPLQAEDKGVVKQIYVREGQRVKQGDLLLELDRVTTAADVERIRKEVEYYKLEIERLKAEKEGRPFAPVRSQDVEPQNFEYQVQLYNSRNNEYQAKVGAADESVRQNEATLSMALINREKFADQLAVNIDKESRLEKLMAQDAVAYFQLLDQRARRMELQQNLAAQEKEVVRSRSLLAQSRQNLSTLVAEHGREIDAKLVEDQKLLTADQEELKKAEKKDFLAGIIAPVDGIVSQFSVYSPGAVVTPAQVLMVLVPEDVTLEMEAWAANKDIGFIYVGQAAEVKVDTFNFQKYGLINAEVIGISPDAEQDKEKNYAYRIRLKLSKESIAVNDRVIPLTPGMTAMAEIKIRQKRVIEYFLDPFRQYKSEALRER
ncbi:MAG: hlyD 2 [Firmicutes bacterium]|nr:hlyD 2 [Bacillota bacterium]